MGALLDNALAVLNAFLHHFGVILDDVILGRSSNSVVMLEDSQMATSLRQKSHHAAHPALDSIRDGRQAVLVRPGHRVNDFGGSEVRTQHSVKLLVKRPRRVVAAPVMVVDIGVREKIARQGREIINGMTDVGAERVKVVLQSTELRLDQPVVAAVHVVE